MKAAVPLALRFGRESCGDLARAASLEWLVTNRMGGYASGTVAGVRTRRYHGLLVAALSPPVGRVVVVTDVHESLHLPGQVVELGAARWRDGTVSPRGFIHLESFRLDGVTPVWRYVIGEHCLEKRVLMAPGRNATIVHYHLVRGGGAVRLEVKVLASYRDYHRTTRAGDMSLEVASDGLDVELRPGAGGGRLRVGGAGMTVSAADSWYRGFLLALERDRGFDCADDALHMATASAELVQGDDASLVMSTDSDTVDPAKVRRQVKSEERAIVAGYWRRQAGAADGVGARLALAASQFVVRRDDGPQEGATIIAGYHWFTDWGRDTMIALPGLTLETGRFEIARKILSTYAHHLDGGMLPNRFPDAGDAVEFNTVDATLWFVEALRLYVEATDDVGFAGEVWPVLETIVRHHEQGTRHGIAVDPADGLLRSGEPGLQLTWMDAKVGDWVVTPRTGKCVEVNALWYSALMTMAAIAGRVGREPEPWLRRASVVKAGFQRFWYHGAGHLYDVLDGPAGDDASLRPNQIFAVSLPSSPLALEVMRAVVDKCASSLVTSHGLRSLAPDHPDYRPTYEGGPRARDGAYHQGTVWAWLIGPFALAHYRVHGDARVARSFLDPLVDHLSSHGVGSVSEIFDGDAPHRPRGAVAQAWSVSEVLRAWSELSRRASGTGHPPGPM